MLANQARRFGETLVDRHVLSRDDLEQAIDESERTKQALPSVLLRLGLVGSKDLTAALADQMGVRFIDFLETPIHQDAPETLSPDLARQYVAVPVDFEGQKLVVAFAEPPSDAALTAVGHATSFEVIPAVADRAELMRAIAMIYGAAEGDADRVQLERRRRRGDRGRAPHQRPARPRHPVGRLRPSPRVGLAARHPRAR